MAEGDLRQMLLGSMTPLALGAGWSDYGAGYETNGARLMGTLVVLKGLVKSSGAVNVGSVIATLLAAMTPGARRVLLLWATGAAGGAGWVRMDVLADGTLQLTGASFALPDTITALSLEASFGL